MALLNHSLPRHLDSRIRPSAMRTTGPADSTGCAEPGPDRDDRAGAGPAGHRPRRNNGSITSHNHLRNTKQIATRHEWKHPDV